MRVACRQCGSEDHWVHVVDGTVCSQCGVVSDEFLTLSSTEFLTDADDPYPSSSSLLFPSATSTIADSFSSCVIVGGSERLRQIHTRATSCATTSAEQDASSRVAHRSLMEDFRTLEHISQLFEKIDENNVAELAKTYASVVKQHMMHSTESRHRSYRGRQRLAVLLACWVCAARQNRHDVAPNVCAAVFRRLPDCTHLTSEKCSKYYNDGRKIVETVLSRTHMVGFTDTRKYETYLLRLATVMDAFDIHRYAVRLIEAIETRGDVGRHFLQAHTPENVAAALFHKASQVSSITFIASDVVAAALGTLGYSVCTTTIRDICTHIENLFRHSGDHGGERRLGSPPPQQCTTTRTTTTGKKRKSPEHDNDDHDDHDDAADDARIRALLTDCSSPLVSASTSLGAVTLRDEEKDRRVVLTVIEDEQSRFLELLDRYELVEYVM